MSHCRFNINNCDLHRICLGSRPVRHWGRLYSTFLWFLFFLFTSPMFLPRMGNTQAVQMDCSHIANCLALPQWGSARWGLGGACLVRGWQPEVVGCVAKGVARGLPSTGLFHGHRTSHKGRHKGCCSEAALRPFTQVMSKNDNGEWDPRNSIGPT